MRQLEIRELQIFLSFFEIFIDYRVVLCLGDCQRMIMVCQVRFLVLLLYSVKI